jgi:hypothetical protein
MALKRSSRPTRGRRSSTDWAELVTKYSLGLVKWAAPAFLAAAGYLAYALFSGKLSSAVDPRIVGNMQLFGQVLAVSGFVATLTLIVVTMEEVSYCVLMGIVALALTFGGPAICVSAKVDPGWPAVKAILEWSALTGHIMLGLVGARILLEIYLQIRDAPRRRAEEQARLEAEGPKKVRNATGVWSKCWELPYCHDTVKEVCPAFKAHKTCWRHGMGCNCDITMIESLIRSGGAMGKGGAKTSSAKATAAAYIRSDLEADVAKPGTTERTIPCSKCPIYNEHQRQKFRIVNPIAVVATIVAFVAMYQPVTMLYHATILAMSTAAARITLGSNTDPSTWFAYLDTSAVRIFFFVIVGLLTLSYVLKLVEWAILEKKW